MRVLHTTGGAIPLRSREWLAAVDCEVTAVHQLPPINYTIIRAEKRS